MGQTHMKQPQTPANNHLEFQQIFEKYKKYVFAVALSILRDSELAEDVMQEAFIKLYQQQKHSEIKNVKAWLISVTRNLALDLYRKKKRELTGFSDHYFEQMSFLSEDPLDKLVLSKYLALLDEDERQIIVLKDITGLKHREIAKIMGIPLGTALWKYRAALKKLQNHMK